LSAGSPKAGAGAELATEVETELSELEVENPPHVGILMGHKRDREVMREAEEELKRRDIRFETRVMSAHRDPELVADYSRNAHMRGLKVIIAGASMSAALAGLVAAHTELPVIGVPLSSPGSVAGGLDAILSTVQMTPGVPVACVRLDGAVDAAVLAARILAV
jgi:5-(carboxyamino)imidazole ribonucleotide mutase